MNCSTRSLLLAASFLAAPTLGQTTVLTFGGASNQTLVSYGDNVTAATMGGLSYGGSGTYTPNVRVAYGGDMGADAGYWVAGFNQLVDVVYCADNSGRDLFLTFTSEPGYEVSLASFDIGNWGNAVTVPEVGVMDEWGTVLWSDTNVPLAANSGMHTSYALSPAPIGDILILYVDLEGLGNNTDNVGLDNIEFSQSTGVITSLGTNYCGPAVTNSTLTGGTMRVEGSASTSAGNTTLYAMDLPLEQFRGTS